MKDSINIIKLNGLIEEALYGYGTIKELIYSLLQADGDLLQKRVVCIIHLYKGIYSMSLIILEESNNNQI